MKIKLKEAAEFIGGIIFGDDEIEIENIAKIEEAQPGELTFLYHPAYAKYLESTKASAIIVPKDFEKTRKDISYIEVEKANIAFQKILIKFFTPSIALSGIDPTSQVHESAKVGNNVTLGKNVVISENCIIGDNSIIHHNTVLMENVSVGNNTLIYPNVTVREGCKIGSRVIIHSGTVIGSDGFGFTPDENGVYFKVPQIGIVIIEDDVELGSNVSIDRAALGSTVIKKGTKVDNLVQIAHNVVVGENTVISAQTGISGSTKIGNNCILAGQVGVVGHIEICDGAIIGAQSGVSKGIAKKATYRGSPAQEISAALKAEAHARNLPAYAERIKKLEKELKEISLKIDKQKEGN